ncbi:unnamed protein product [Effrenium voratum]|nr:unnamed protein product [Effrenium voratum]
MLDHSLGEVFGHCVLGDIKPTSTWRSFSYLARYARSHGVRIVKKACGSVPAWPETLRTARQRYAGAFLSYLRRAEVSKRNFVLVSHADCIASILALIPSKAGRMVESVSYGATVLGSLPMDPRGTSSPAEQQEETLDPKESRPSKGAWQVELDRVRMGPRWRGGDAASSTAKRAMKSYCYNKLDVCMLQELLGGLSEEPLGDVSPKGVKPAVEQPEAESSWDQPNEIGDDVSCCSSSTFLFGDSETGSEFESSPISPISPGAAKAHSFCVADSQPYSPSFERLVSRGSQEAAKGGATRLRFGTTGSISDDGSPSRGSASRSSSVGRVKLQGRDGSAIMARRLKMTG